MVKHFFILTTFSSSRRSSTISINFVVPQGWHELSDKQLRYVYQLLADDFATDKIKTLFLLPFIIFWPAALRSSSGIIIFTLRHDAGVINFPPGAELLFPGIGGCSE